MIQRRSDRLDATALILIDEWIDEVIRTVEQAYPFSYTKKAQEATITADNKTFDLPSNLILHHPYDLLLKDAVATEPTYHYLIKVGDRTYSKWFVTPDLSGNSPAYWRLSGGSNANEFQTYPVQNANRTLRIYGGYFYSGAFTTDAGSNEGDSESNWLTVNYPNLVLEGVAFKLFTHYGEDTKAESARVLYQAYLAGDALNGIEGLIKAEKKMQNRGRRLRMKTWDDVPLATAINQRNYSN